MQTCKKEADRREQKYANMHYKHTTRGARDAPILERYWLDARGAAVRGVSNVGAVWLLADPAVCVTVPIQPAIMHVT